MTREQVITHRLAVARAMIRSGLHAANRFLADSGDVDAPAIAQAAMLAEVARAVESAVADGGDQ